MAIREQRPAIAILMVQTPGRLRVAQRATKGDQMPCFDIDAAQEASNRLDDGEYDQEDRENLVLLAEQYESYLQNEQDKFVRREAEIEFHIAWPEPSDGARIEWENSDGSLFGARRDENNWWMYNDPNGGPHTWREIVESMPDNVINMTFVAILREVR